MKDICKQFKGMWCNKKEIQWLCLMLSSRGRRGWATAGAKQLMQWNRTHSSMTLPRSRKLSCNRHKSLIIWSNRTQNERRVAQKWLVPKLLHSKRAGCRQPSLRTPGWRGNRKGQESQLPTLLLGVILQSLRCLLRLQTDLIQPIFQYLIRKALALIQLRRARRKANAYLSLPIRSKKLCWQRLGIFNLTVTTTSSA